jgi:N-acetylglucosamine-6-sulfatase
MRLARLAPISLLLLGFLAGAPAHAQPDTRPNVLFVMTDDQTVESLRVMTRVKEGVVAEGTNFTQAISTYPLCCPSRATYLTGQYSHNHGVIHNAGAFGGYTRLDNFNTLPVWLQRSGYRTIHVGRYLNGYGTQNPDRTEIPPGWEDWNSTVDPTTFNFTKWTMNENGRLFEVGPEGEFQTDYLGRRASEEILQAAADPRPFFLSLTFPAPHSGAPIDSDDPPSLRTPSPAPRHRNVFANEPLPRGPNFGRANRLTKPQIVADRRRFSAEDVSAIQENYQQELESLLSVDEAVGGLLSTLGATGELDNTVIIYTSDNGFFHGEHGVRSEKVLPYEPGIRTPLVMRGPGVPAGRRLNQLVGNVDLAPTIMDIADAVPSRVPDGRSLFTLLGDRTRELGREFVLENGRGVNSVPQYRALRNNRFLYVRHDTTGELELYDLRKDPFQLKNL